MPLGDASGATATVEIVTGVNNLSVSNEVVLYQNEPNPFSASTNIRFQLASSCFVKLAIYDILGNEKAVLINRFVESGQNELRFKSSEFELRPGVYFYSLTAKDFFVIRKMVIVD